MSQGLGCLERERERERERGGNEEGCIIIPTQFTAIRDHSSPSLTAICLSFRPFTLF